jgi:sulfonate transport system permease protein
MKRIVKQATFFIALLCVWELVYRLHIWPPYLFPSSRDVFESLRAGFADRTFLLAIGISMRRILIGFTISVVGGMTLGAVIAASDYLETTLGSMLVSFQSLPSLCWLPLAVLWFGLNEKAIIFVVVMGSLVSLTISTVTGFRRIPKIYFQAGRNLGAQGPKMFFFIILPASLPHLVTGLKQGWAFAWRSLIAGEMLFVSLGLGQLLMMGRDLNDMSQVLAVMGLIMVTGHLVDQVVFERLERHVRQRWGLAGEAV